MKTSIDFGKLKNETLQAMANDGGFPEEFRTAAETELKSRDNAPTPPIVKQVAGGSLLVGSFAGRSDRLVKSMEKKAAAAKGRR